MADYIKRDALTTELKRLEFGEHGFVERILADGAYAVIESMPAADVAPVVHGHWIEDGDYQICSECGEEHCWDEYRAAYCDSCGAKMDGKDGDGNG